MLKKLDMKFV